MGLQPGGRAADDGGGLKCLQACAYAAPCGQRIARSPDGVPSRLMKGPLKAYARASVTSPLCDQKGEGEGEAGGEALLVI